MSFHLLDRVEKVFVFVNLVISLYVPVLYCNQYGCQHMKVISKRKLPANDFKALLTLEDKTFSLVLHKYLHQCKTDKRCIGFEICKISEHLFRCQACCQWKKRKEYGFLVGPSDCTYYEQNTDFGTNIALNAKATLSSEHNKFHKASNAVDGITTCPDSSFVAGSTVSSNTWLLIEFERVFSIHMVAVYARMDGWEYQANDIFVVVNGENSDYECGGTYQGPTESADVILFPCVSGSLGRCVTIFKTTTTSLGLCEVEVYGH